MRRPGVVSIMLSTLFSARGLVNDDDIIMGGMGDELNLNNLDIDMQEDLFNVPSSAQRGEKRVSCVTFNEEMY